MIDTARNRTVKKTLHVKGICTVRYFTFTIPCMISRYLDGYGHLTFLTDMDVHPGLSIIYVYLEHILWTRLVQDLREQFLCTLTHTNYNDSCEMKGSSIFRAGSHQKNCWPTQMSKTMHSYRQFLPYCIWFNQLGIIIFFDIRWVINAVVVC